LARKILLADDSVTAQNMGRRILTDAGYEVITVNNGSAALKKIAESKPDLIILDVYMPGYGGLEVCQRLKESQETARIPVLLSVGKLEPFKVEESRRVRADGFIIKPFEASELLTALTKLEDKIVPQAESFKSGRFAKAIAAAEQAATTQGIGEESGWQNRLAIPRGTPKPEGAEKQEPRPESAGLRDTAQREESKSVAMKSAEATVAAALPQGITVEELAAIAAAANTFVDKRETSAAKTAEPEVPATAKTESPVEGKTESPAAEVAEAVTFASAPASQAEARQMVQTPAQAAELQRATTDAEVLAALASLSPKHTEAVAPAAESASANGDKAGAHHGEEVPVTASDGERVVAETRASGPRWIAQAVAIADDESTLILEREMEKAYAAMTALEADKENASAPAAAETNTAIMAEAAPVATSTEPGFPPAEISSSNAAESSPQTNAEELAPTPEVSSPVAAPVAVAEPEVVAAVSVPEVSSPEAAAAPETSSTSTENVTSVSETKVPVTSENAAYAAVASAGSGMSDSGIQAESSPTAEVPTSAEESIAAAPAVSDPGRESELAAAWHNWKQIRESILGSQSSADLTRAASEFKEIRREDAAVAAQPGEASSEAAPSDSIANIVDSVLAELKPKLMEEISKKMGKDKKKK